MRRGTTPTLECSLDVSLVDADYYVTIEQGTVSITKTASDCTLSEDGKTISVTLSQEETLSLSSDDASGLASVQVRYKADGKVYATNIAHLRVDGVLMEEVI